MIKALDYIYLLRMAAVNNSSVFNLFHLPAIYIGIILATLNYFDHFTLQHAREGEKGLATLSLPPLNPLSLSAICLTLFVSLPAALSVAALFFLLFPLSSYLRLAFSFLFFYFILFSLLIFGIQQLRSLLLPFRRPQPKD